MTDPDHCHYCGRLLPPEAQFCGGCGRAANRGADGGGPPTIAIPATGPGYPAGPNVDPYGSDRRAAGRYDAGPYDPDPGDPPRRRRVLPWVLVAVVVAVGIVALVVMHGSGGSSHAGATPTTPANTGPIVMPSVVMFNAHQAVADLEQAGVQKHFIKLHAQVHVDVAPGTVLDQTPAAGITIGRTVTLTVATAPATFPDFVGHGINAARATLSTLGVTLTVQDKLDATVSDGTVLAQSPAAGAPFASAIQLTVARTPIATNIGDLTPGGTAPTQNGSETIAGTSYENSVGWQLNVCPEQAPISVTYELGDTYRQFVATAGLAAAANPADRVDIDIRIDGKIEVAHDLDAQTPLPVDLDVTNHRTLELTFTPVNMAGVASCSKVTLALGRAQLLSSVDDTPPPTTTTP